MIDTTRRVALRGAGVAIVAGLVGCTGREGPGSGDGGVDYEVHQLGPTSATPDWARGDDATGTVELFRSRETAGARLEGAILPGLPAARRDPALEFLRETEFERSALVYVASVGPDDCHTEIEVRDLALDGDALTGTVAVLDTSDPGEGCAEVITYPSALVRVTADPLPGRARLTVANGWDETSTVEATPAG